MFVEIGARLYAAVGGSREEACWPQQQLPSRRYGRMTPGSLLVPLGIALQTEDFLTCAGMLRLLSYYLFSYEYSRLDILIRVIMVQEGI